MWEEPLCDGPQCTGNRKFPRLIETMSLLPIPYPARNFSPDLRLLHLVRASSNALGGAAALKMGPLLCRFTAWGRAGGPLQVKKPEN